MNYHINEKRKRRDEMLSFFILVCSGILFAVSIYAFIEKSKCAEQVPARYIGEVPYHSSRNVTRYAVQLEYRYLGKQYLSRTFESFSGKRIQELRKQSSLTIYVNPRNPNRVCIDKKIQGNDLLLFFFGIIFFVCASFV